MSVETARLQWEDGLRRLAAEERGDAARGRELVRLVETVIDELRRRVGQTFELAELAATYDGAEDWVRDVVFDSTGPRARADIRDTALVQDAAFGRYARGALDYTP